MALILAFVITLSLISTIAAQSPLQIESIHGFPSHRLSSSDRAKPSVESFDSINPLHKLNDSYIPIKYDLELMTLLDEEDTGIGPQFTVRGKVLITFRPAETTRTIILHSNVLEVFSVDLINVNTSSVIGLTGPPVFSGDDKHFMTLTSSEDLNPENHYDLDIIYRAAINTESLDGLYLSWYTADDGSLKRIATTQMQAYHARQLFPCFDEPGLKAVFNLQVIHKMNYTTVLGNSDVASIEPFNIDGWNVTTFNPTVRMATYLFAMVVSDLGNSPAAENIFRLPVKTYAPPPVVARRGAEYASEIAAGLLAFFDEYFGYDYPMQKMDSVHIPHFSAGAMENWGLNIYREAYLIYYPNESLESYKNLLTSVVSHELAHQNFGNLVTCKWWNELWLNEGFATYVSYLGVDAVRPEFRQREWILNDAFQYSMRVDVSSTSHPIVNDAITPSQVDSYFTGITYEKGGSVNRMTEKFLTEETYQKGLRYYLSNMSYQGVVSDDLFHYLDTAAVEDNRLPSGVTVKKVLDSWTLQKSHPLVRVSAAGPNSVFISQERYADPVSVDLWWVPVTVVTQDAPTLENWVPRLWLEDNAGIKSVDHDTSKWIMINQDATGYYRVLYDAHLTNLISAQLNADTSVITPLSRSQLLDDYFNLAYRGIVEIQTGLGLTKYLGQEDHFTVWEVVFTQLRTAYNFVQGDEEYNTFKNYLAPMLRTALEKAGVEQNDTVHIGAAGVHRSKLIDWSVALRDETAINYANTLYGEWSTDPTKIIPRDIEAPIACSIVANGAEAEFDFMVAKYTATPLANPSKLRYLNAMACSRNPILLQSLLELSLVPVSYIDPTHALGLIQRVALNTQGRQLVIEFLQTEVDRIISVLGGGSPAPVASILGSLSTYLSRQEDLDLVLKFVVDNSAKFTAIAGSLNTYLNTIRSNIAWKVTFGKPILAWMAENGPEQPQPTSPPTSPTSPPTGSTSPTIPTTPGSATMAHPSIAIFLSVVSYAFYYF